MNIEVMNSYNIKRIVTTCPHSFNTLKNEYKGLEEIMKFTAPYRVYYGVII